MRPGAAHHRDHQGCTGKARASTSLPGTRATIVRLGGNVGLDEFHYPMRQFLDPMERIRFVGSVFVHAVKKPVWDDRAAAASVTVGAAA